MTVPRGTSYEPTHSAERAVNQIAYTPTPSKVDEAAFGIATDLITPMGYLADETAPDSVVEGQVGIARMGLDRIALSRVKDGDSVALGALADAAVADAAGSVNAHARQIAKVITAGLTIVGGFPNNLDVTLLASAARTTTQTSANLTNLTARGIHVMADVTSIGTGGITVGVWGVDPASNTIYPIAIGSGIVANNLYVVRIYPGIDLSGYKAASDHLPRVFKIIVTALNANPVTYSVGYSLLL